MIKIFCSNFGSTRWVLMVKKSSSIPSNLSTVQRVQQERREEAVENLCLHLQFALQTTKTLQMKRTFWKITQLSFIYKLEKRSFKKKRIEMKKKMSITQLCLQSSLVKQPSPLSNIIHPMIHNNKRHTNMWNTKNMSSWDTIFGLQILLNLRISMGQS